ncbi:MAG: hypothetical protein AAB596_01215 [Patescibacteria group bacterium]
MKKYDYILKSLINASGVFVYVLIVAWVLFNAKEIFKEPAGLLIPIFMLLLLIISATITGLLVLGKPIYLYFNGLKKEAIILLFATLAWLVVFLIVVIIALLMQ